MNNTEYDLITKEKLIELYEEALDEIERLRDELDAASSYEEGFEEGCQVGYDEGFEDGKASVEPDPYNNGGY